MASTQSRVIRLLSGTRTEVDGIPSYDTATDLLVNDLTPRRIEGDYQAKTFVTGHEGAQGDRLYNATMGLQFMVDAAPSGAAGTAPPFAPLLTACGLQETISAGVSAGYSLVPNGMPKSEIALQYVDEATSQVTEQARGTLSFTAETRRPPMFGFNFMGAHFDGQAAVAVDPDFAGWSDAPECSPENMNAITLDGTSLCVQSFTFTDGRTPARNKFMNCGDTDITPRNVTGRLVVRLEAASAGDVIAKAKSGMTSPFVWQIGSEPGSILRIAAPAVQVKYGGEQDISGEIGLNLDLVFTKDQGDDEFAVIFS